MKPPGRAATLVAGPSASTRTPGIDGAQRRGAGEWCRARPRPLTLKCATGTVGMSAKPQPGALEVLRSTASARCRRWSRLGSRRRRRRGRRDRAGSRPRSYFECRIPAGTGVTDAFDTRLVEQSALAARPARAGSARPRLGQAQAEEPRGRGVHELEAQALTRPATSSVNAPPASAPGATGSRTRRPRSSRWSARSGPR